MFFLLASAEAGSNIDLLPDKAFHKEGDLNLGGFTYNQGYSLEAPCADFIMFLPLHQRAHSVAYYIEQYNNRQDILPNVTLGYTILDECFRDIPAIPRFIQLLPVLNKSADSLTSLSVGRHYDVVGLIGPVSGTPTIILATMTGFFQIPQIGSTPSDELSDKVRFPYYFRMIPPDRFQSYAFIKVVKELKWEYISVVYIEANYGFNANRYISQWAHDEGICIEDYVGLDYAVTDAEYEAIVKKLVDGKARVVVIFAYADSVSKLMQAHGKLQVGGELIWVIPESIPLGMILSHLPAIKGSFYIQLNEVLDPGLVKYYEAINPWNTPHDPWLNLIWEQFYGCKMNPKENEPDCRDFEDITGIPAHMMDTLAHRAGNAVHPFVYALHNLIEDHCKQAVGNREQLRECVKPEMLADYLRKVDIDTPSGRVKFDKNQDNLRDYVFKQIQDDGMGSVKLVTVARYDLVNESIAVYKDLMQWPDNVPKSRYNVENVPESVCSYPCGIGEMYIQGEVPCCWECKKCRNNEIVTNNQTECTICDELTWPELEFNLTTCSLIPPTYLTWGNIYAIGLICLAGCGFLSVSIIILVVIKHRDRRVIKGSSRELVGIILAGIVLAFMTVPAFISKPSNIGCNISRTGFSISSSLIFGPLFIKSVRIFRVFLASSNFETSLKWVGVQSQMVLAAITIGIQVIMQVNFARY